MTEESSAEEQSELSGWGQPDLREEFLRELQKRERHMTAEQQRMWSDGLLKHLPDSLAYQAACTPEARRAEERKLNLYLELYLQSKTPASLSRR